MKKSSIRIKGYDITVFSLNTVIVGTGAAGFNAADSLYSLGQKDIAIVTEGVRMGTSRNTGSDKQTYYKLTLSGDVHDSVMDMAKTLFDGGCMHGDIALVEAALSTRCFFKLAGIGVPFPHNRYGEYVGYKTDHDPRQRATSAGPLTSRYMTEKLEEQVKQKGISIFEGYQVIGIIIGDADQKDGKSAIGLIALDLSGLESHNMGFTLFNCTNVVYATGGPAGMYKTSVYPECHTGATGTAFEAGAKGINLTESQYGLASIKFRWNLSGTYQQVLPRYISTDAQGFDEKEFLLENFPDMGKMLDAIFLKGYQWPFDPRKITDYGSSLIDLLVYNEIEIKGRRVFLDYTINAGCTTPDEKFDFSQLSEEAYSYLKNSEALFGTPVQRLKKMNQPAIDLYKNNGIDLNTEYLEIAVCAQHNNGGLMGNIWWESNIQHLFPVGEVNGTFGIYRPGGSALNSTQVGSFRAAQYINSNYTEEPLELELFAKAAKNQIVDKLQIAEKYLSNSSDISNIIEFREQIQSRMTKYGAHIRSFRGAAEAAEKCRIELTSLENNVRLKSVLELPFAFMNRDILITQYVYLKAILEYIKKGGKSRGSYLINDIYDDGINDTHDINKLIDIDKIKDDDINPINMKPAFAASGGLLSEYNALSGIENKKEILEGFKFSLDNGEHSKEVCLVNFENIDGRLECKFIWEPVRPIPREDNWFENVWKDYREGNIN